MDAVGVSLGSVLTECDGCAVPQTTVSTFPSQNKKLSYNENEKHILQTDLFPFRKKKRDSGLWSDRLPDSAEGRIVGGKK